MLKSQRFLASGTFIVPAGVSCIWITQLSGGGAGMDSYDQPPTVGPGGAGGGSGGHCHMVPQKVVPGSSLTITVGAAGLRQLSSAPVNTHQPLVVDTPGAIEYSWPGGGASSVVSSSSTMMMEGGWNSWRDYSYHSQPGFGGGAAYHWMTNSNPSPYQPSGYPGRSAGGRFFSGGSGGTAAYAGLITTGDFTWGNGAWAGGNAGGSGGQTRFTFEPGGFPSGWSSGGGASSPWGKGGSVNANANGSPGTGLGSAGAGAALEGYSPWGEGGNGTSGFVLITWAAPA